MIKPTEDLTLNRIADSLERIATSMENTERRDINISRKVRPKIAIYSNKGWSIGRIHDNVMKYLSNDYDFKFFNWHNNNDKNEFNSTWNDYDVILGNGTISTLGEEFPIFYKKAICVSWAEPNLKGGFFVELIGDHPDILWGAPTSTIQKSLKDHFNINAMPVIAGVDKKDFFPTRKINKITTLGLNGIPFTNEGWDLIKRPDMMVDITHRAKLKHKFIYNQPLTDNHDLYKDIDMYICTSSSEAGPYGIAEAAFCKIPVISTPVGYASKFKSIKTFTTVDEAVSIINDLNSNPKKLEKYINDVYEELTRELNWEHVANTYWKPLIEKRINA